jgi:hypothetical protein
MRVGEGWVKPIMDETRSYDKVCLSIGTFPAITQSQYMDIGKQECRDGLYHPF